MALHAGQLHVHAGHHAQRTTLGDTSLLGSRPRCGQQLGSQGEVGQCLLVQVFLCADRSVLGRAGLHGTLAIDAGDSPESYATDEVALTQYLVGFLLLKEAVALRVHVVDDLVDVVQAVVHSLPGQVQTLVAVVVVGRDDKVGISLELGVGALAPSLVATQNHEHLEPAAEVAGAAPCGIGSRQSLIELFGGLPEGIGSLLERIAQAEPVVAARGEQCRCCSYAAPYRTNCKYMFKSVLNHNLVSFLHYYIITFLHFL